MHPAVTRATEWSIGGSTPSLRIVIRRQFQWRNARLQIGKRQVRFLPGVFKTTWPIGKARVCKARQQGQSPTLVQLQPSSLWP